MRGAFHKSYFGQPDHFQNYKEFSFSHILVFFVVEIFEHPNFPCHHHPTHISTSEPFIEKFSLQWKINRKKLHFWFLRTQPQIVRTKEGSSPSNAAFVILAASHLCETSSMKRSSPFHWSFKKFHITALHLRCFQSQIHNLNMWPWIGLNHNIVFISGPFGFTIWMATVNIEKRYFQNNLDKPAHWLGKWYWRNIKI